MGVILGSAVCPIALCVTWKKASKAGCIGGSIVGLAAGIIAWLVTTSTLNDSAINVTVRLFVFLMILPMNLLCFRQAEVRGMFSADAQLD